MSFLHSPVPAVCSYCWVWCSTPFVGGSGAQQYLKLLALRDGEDACFAMKQKGTAKEVQLLPPFLLVRQK